MTDINIQDIKPEIFTGKETVPAQEREETDAIAALTLLERSLSEFSDGDYITIMRLQPPEFVGALERIPVDPSNPIDLQYLINKWGGTHLRIGVYGPGQKGRKAGFDIPLKSFPPRSNYKLLRAHGEEPERPAPPPAPPPVDPMAMVGAIIEMSKRLNPPPISSGPDVTELIRLVLRTQQAPKTDPMGELQRTIGLIKEMQGLGGFGNNSGDDDVFGKIAGIAEKFLTMSQQQNSTPSVTASAVRAPVLPSAPTPRVMPDPMQIIQLLGSMEPDQIGQMVSGYIASLPDERREMVMGSVIRGMGMQIDDRPAEDPSEGDDDESDNDDDKI